jgi:hypothetical protein
MATPTLDANDVRGHDASNGGFAFVKVTQDAAEVETSLYIETGFVPKYVKVINATTIETHEWFYGFGAGDGLKVTTAAGTTSWIASNGMTVQLATNGAAANYVTVDKFIVRRSDVAGTDTVTASKGTSVADGGSDTGGSQPEDAINGILLGSDVCGTTSDVLYIAAWG